MVGRAGTRKAIRLALTAVAVAWVGDSAAQGTPPSGDLNTMINGLRGFVLQAVGIALIAGGVIGLVMCVRTIMKLYAYAEREPQFMSADHSGISQGIALLIGFFTSISSVIIGWLSLAWVSAG